MKYNICLFWLEIDDTFTKSNLNRLYKLRCFIICSVLYQYFLNVGKMIQNDSSKSFVVSILHQNYTVNCIFNFLLYACVMIQAEPFSFLSLFGRTRSSSLFSPLNSSADRVDVQLQSYHKSYSHQQMFAQQQGIDSRLVSSRRPRRTNTKRYSCIGSVNVTDRCTPLVVCQGCVYGEQKVIQPASSGGFEAASYFTNTAASHSAGESSMYYSQNNWKMDLKLIDEKSVFELSCWLEWFSPFLHCHLQVLRSTASPLLDMTRTPSASTPPPHCKNRLFFQARTTCWMDSEPLSVMNATCLHDWFADCAASFLETLASVRN